VHTAAVQGFAAGIGLDAGEVLYFLLGVEDPIK
jgi:hypothetical protein